MFFRTGLPLPEMPGPDPRHRRDTVSDGEVFFPLVGDPRGKTGTTKPVTCPEVPLFPHSRKPAGTKRKNTGITPEQTRIPRRESGRSRTDTLQQPLNPGHGVWDMRGPGRGFSGPAPALHDLREIPARPPLPAGPARTSSAFAFRLPKAQQIKK